MRGNWVPIRMAAAQQGRTIRTLEYWIQAGLLHPICPSGNITLVNVDELKAARFSIEGRRRERTHRDA